MATLVLKLALTPLLIVGASLAGRRWGAAVSGWLIGLPLTSGPVAAFLTVEHGPRFAARTAVGSLSGVAAEVAFCLGYGWSARRGWPTALAAGIAGFVGAAAGIQALPLSPGLPTPLLPLYAAGIAALGAGLVLLPRADGAPAAAALPPARWELPARAVVATGLVVLLTGVATTLGARLTGLVSVFPLYASVLGAFAHRSEGRAGALEVLRGVLLGLASFGSFCLVVAALLGRISSVAAFAAAIAATLAVQAATLRAARR